MGVHLVNLLSSNPDCRITVTSRSRQEGKGNVSYVQGNGHDIAFLNTLLKDKYDVIVDFMNYHTEEFRERYRILLNACGQYVYLSSSRVYADSDSPITEEFPRLLDVTTDAEYLRTDEYALAKARQENLLRESGYKNWTIIRPYITYSEIRLQLGVLEKEAWLYRALQGRAIVFSKDIAERMTTLTYGLDVARAMAALIGREEAKGEAFHITTPESIRWSEVQKIYLDVLERETGKRPRVLLTEESLNLQYAWGKYQVKYDRLFNRTFDNGKIGRFIDTDCFVKLSDKHIYIVPSPLIPVSKPTTIGNKAYIVRKFFSRVRVRIEIIVHMDGIHIVACNNVAHYLADVFSVFRKSRVEIKLTGVLHKKFRMFVVRMYWRQTACSLSAGTIRINPCMQLHTTLVTLVYHKLQRIPRRRRCNSLNTCQKTAPWFIRRFIKSIGLGTYLKDNGIYACFFQLVQLAYKCFLHSFYRHSLELSVYTLYPRSSKFTFRRCCLCTDRKGIKQQGSKNNQSLNSIHLLYIVFERTKIVQTE